MNQELLDQHEDLVIEMGNLYLDNMELELGRKYADKGYEMNATLSDDQYVELRTKYDLSIEEFSEIFNEFQKMEPTSHLKKVMDAFTASGGNADIEPAYDEKSQRLSVTLSFEIKGNKLETIEGLSPMEELILKLNAMLQVENILSGADPDVSPSF